MAADTFQIVMLCDSAGAYIMSLSIKGNPLFLDMIQPLPSILQKPLGEMCYRTRYRQVYSGVYKDQCDWYTLDGKPFFNTPTETSY